MTKTGGGGEGGKGGNGGSTGGKEGAEEGRERGVHDDLRGAPASDIDPLFRSGN